MHSYDALFFHPYAIRIEPLRPGVARVTTYERASAYDGYLIEYDLSSDTIMEVSSTPITLNESDPESEGAKQYHRLFSDSRYTPDVYSCRFRDLYLDPHAPWHKGY